MIIPFALVLSAGHPHEAPPKPEGVALGKIQTLGHGVSVRPERIVEDSRCPEEVLCVWAGRLVVEATAMRGFSRKIFEITLGSSTEFANGAVTFTTAPPRKISMKQPDDYVFGFSFIPSTE